ncbi:MAG: zinc ribbon domain-containing protein [Caldilinea sp.]
MSSVMGFVIALGISGLALLAVAWPLLKKAPPPPLVEEDRLTELLYRKDQVMTSIKELEFDYRVGKLSDEDYQLFDQRLRRQAILLLQQIEQVVPASAGLDAALEREVERRRKVVGGADSRTQGTDAIEAEVARRRQVAVAPASVAQRYCTHCGTALAEHHKFCANCGTATERVASALPAEIG